MGDFDDCLEVAYDHQNDQFQGKYCLVSVNTPQLGYYTSVVERQVIPKLSKDYFQELSRNWLVIRNRFPFLHGVCVPSICTEAQLEKLILKCKF